MIVLVISLVLVGVLLTLPGISDLVSLLHSGLRQRARGPNPDVPRGSSEGAPKLLFLVLAHDEELLLPACLSSLLRQDYPSDRRSIVVVADNCVDRTAARARAAGVDVLERREAWLRGKPRAIAWALERLEVQGYDAVVIIDADTEVDRGFAAAVAAQGPLAHEVSQPFIGVQNPDESALTRMADVHATATHHVAYLVKERAGINVPLGVGMCIGRAVLMAEPWKAFSIGEDWELYAIYTARGVRIRPVRQAVIRAQEARSLRQSAPQRRRWMAGKLDVLWRYGWRLLTSSHVSPAQRLDAIAELCSLGPAVHLGVASLGITAALVLPLPARGLVLALFAISLVRPVAYTAIAIGRVPSPGRAILAFLFLPIYTLWRLGPAARSVLLIGMRRWDRTQRHAARDRGPS